MTTTALQHPLPDASPLIYGCMGLGGGWNSQPLSEADIDRAQAAVEAALDIGITRFDHADIYTHGKAEACFGALFKRQPALRQRLRLQSKCGIRFADKQGPGRYDLSAAHIERSVEASLQRLGSERIELLLLHRPDPLLEPAEVAEAFARLRAAGKVGQLGVSNMNAAQMQWLASALDAPLAANQLELSLARLDAIEAGTCFNDAQALQRPGSLAWAGTLEYCQRERIPVQAWGALAQGLYSGRAGADAAPAVTRSAALVRELAEQHATAPESIVLAWLMRHPAGIQPVIGTADPARIRACGDAARIRLSREDWYALYVAARGQALP
ncbi:aldo/keto reductase [Paucibacter sp. O1-1]|nr:aldo/keto reductase [Paucibacter sp. O1-1]MDA3824726.1 aldo/keto reductase [Paucibacter sp. O1-1]